MDPALKEAFAQVERYVMPLISAGSESRISKDENRVLALQNVNRLNQRIGFLARQVKTDKEKIRLLQTYVNSLTIGLKTDNVLLIKNAIVFVRNIVDDVGKD